MKLTTGKASVTVVTPVNRAAAASWPRFDSRKLAELRDAIARMQVGVGVMIQS
jgi:hypothetical protein